MRRLLRRREGFTLIELMIVILIIAILVAIAVPVYLNAQNNAKKRTCQANQRTIDGAVNTWYSDADSYPTTLAEMTGASGTLKKIPSCPVGPSSYTFSAATAGGPPSASCPNGHASQD